VVPGKGEGRRAGAGLWRLTGAVRIATLNRRHFAVVRPRHADAFELLPQRRKPP
jgi:hypothetical protein